MELVLASSEVLSSPSLCINTPEQKALPTFLPAWTDFVLLLDHMAMVFSQVWPQACNHKEGQEEQQLLFHLPGQSRSDRG